MQTCLSLYKNRIGFVSLLKQIRRLLNWCMFQKTEHRVVRIHESAFLLTDVNV